MPDHTAPLPTVPPPSDVTVVVPTRNAARTLAACLQSLRAQTHPCRTVVVDNGSTDGTRAIAEAGADVVLDMGPERSAQRNHGARSCPAQVVGFVDADMILQATVVEEAVAALRSGAGSVIVPERTVGSGFWVEVRAFERSFYDGSDAIEAARFFRWDIFDRAGGFDEQLTGPEDWDLSESARKLAPVARTTAVIEHDEGTIGYLDACRKKAYYAEGMRRYVAKRGMIALTQAARRPWLHHPRKLINRRGVGLVALKLGETVAVGLSLGRMWLAKYAPTINQLQVRCPIPKPEELATDRFVRMTKERNRRKNDRIGLVVFITGHLSSPSGGDVHALRLAEHWAQTRGVACVIGPRSLEQMLEDTPNLTLQTPVVPFERILAKTMATYPLLCIIRALVYAVTAPRADWNVASSHFAGDILACLLRRLRGGSSAVYVHHLIKLASRPPGVRTALSIIQETVCLFVIKIFECVLVIDPIATDWLLARGFDRSRVHQCRNGSSPPTGVLLSSKAPQPTILFVGRLTKEKGAADFMRIVYEATKGRIDTTVDVVGDGPLRNELQDLADDLGLAVTFHGYVNEAEKWRLLSSAHVLVAPSYEEGWGITVDEALWAGAEIVCYDLSAFKTIKDSLHCVPVGDINGAASVVRTLLERRTIPMARRLPPNRLASWLEIVEEESMILDKQPRGRCR